MDESLRRAHAKICFYLFLGALAVLRPLRPQRRDALGLRNLEALRRLGAVDI